jgi:hypothetical protein
LRGGCDEDFSIGLDCNSAATVSDIAVSCILQQGQDLENDTNVGSNKIHYLEPAYYFMEVVRNSTKLPISRFQYRLPRLEWDGQGAEHLTSATWGFIAEHGQGSILRQAEKTD